MAGTTELLKEMRMVQIAEQDNIQVVPKSKIYDSANGNSEQVSNSKAVVHASSNTNNPYLPWNDYFMSLCYLSAARSKDPKTKVGACIVDKENRVISLGYNGMPRGISDKDLPWGKEATHIYETKYPYVCHAEMNAILNDKRVALDGCCLYVTKFPCCECAKLIIQSGIKHVIFTEKKPDPFEEQIPSKRMFNLAGVICKKFVPSVHHLSLNVVDGVGSVSIS